MITKNKPSRQLMLPFPGPIQIEIPFQEIQPHTTQNTGETTEVLNRIEARIRAREEDKEELTNQYKSSWKD